MEKSPIFLEQEKAQELCDICGEILRNARNELYLNLRFMDTALSALLFSPDTQRRGVATDGFCLRFQPEDLVLLYRRGRVYVNRIYLHMVLHCIFLHMDTRRGREKNLWDLSCDIAAEALIDGFLIKALRLPPSPARREMYERLKKQTAVMNAQSIYDALEKEAFSEGRLKRIAAEFYADSHDLWEDDRKPNRSRERQNRWEEIRQTMETEMETFSKMPSGEAGDLRTQIHIENREKTDYREFLRQFSVMRETMQVDMDAFDYIYYDYGLRTYGNMPLIEPLETKEIKKIQEFVIVIDTSMSCSGELVRQFLEETYSVLTQSETYFKKVNIHIIQCDDRVREDVAITSAETLKSYMERLTINGCGGTDFRPAFQYVDELVGKQRFSRLKGLLYFTDGRGIYPVKRPAYDTAFVFMEQDFLDVDVPPWAMKIILSPEDLDRDVEEKG